MSSVGVFPDVFDQSEEHYAPSASFDGTDTLALDSNTWNRVFVKEIEEGTGAIHGRGDTENPLQAEGYIGATLMNSDPDADGDAQPIQGKYRIVVRTKASDTRVDTIIRGALGEVDLYDHTNGERKDRSDLQEFKQREQEATTKEYYYAFEVQPKTAETVDLAPADGVTDIHAEGYVAERTA